MVEINYNGRTFEVGPGKEAEIEIREGERILGGYKLNRMKDYETIFSNFSLEGSLSLLEIEEILKKVNINKLE